MRKNYTIGERAIIVLGAMAGKTLQEINETLAKEQKKTGMPVKRVPAASYKMMVDTYLRDMGFDSCDTEVMSNAFNYANKPKTLTEISKGVSIQNYNQYPEYFDGIQTSELGDKYGETDHIQHGSEKPNSIRTRYSC